MKCISFDFDGVLGDNNSMKYLASGFINLGYDVIVLTTRKHKDMEEVFEVAEFVGIKKENVFNTDYIWKFEYLNLNSELKERIDLHIDDNYDEVIWLNNNGVKAILVNEIEGFRG